MRESLKQSQARDTGFERYAKGSIVLCNACAAPIFKLDGGIALGDKAGQMVNRFKPLTLPDLEALADREDIDAGVRATLRGWSPEARKEHIAQLCEVKTGDPMMCPICHDCFPQVLAVERDEVLDRAYTVELITIPPDRAAAIRGKRLSATGDWIH